MMEPVVMPEFQPVRTTPPEWAVGSPDSKERVVLTSINIDPPNQEKFNVKMMTRWEEVEKNEVRYKGYYLDDAEYVVIGYGTAGRIALTAVRAAREQGLKIGLLRPISLSPFPTKMVDELADRSRVSGGRNEHGQMLDDVVSIAARRVPVDFYGRMGGMVPYPDEIANAIIEMIQGEHDVNADGRRNGWQKCARPWEQESKS